MAKKSQAVKKKKAVARKEKPKQAPKKSLLPKKSNSRKYEGAAKGKRLSRWDTQSTSANSETYGAIATLRNRARDLRRNNPYAKRGIEGITNNVVGDGILTQFRSAGDVAQIEALWKQWADSNEIDFDGRNNIYGLQKLVMDAVAESGEVLVRKRFDSSKRFPLQFQILESDFLDTTKVETVAANGNNIIQGIEFDKQGRRVAYYLFETHPGGFDQSFFISNPISNRVPASEVYHVYRMDRPGQARGVTWLAPIILRLRDLDDFEDAQLVRQKIAACFTAFVRDIGADITDEDEDCDETELADRLEPGVIEHLPAGKTIEFAKPPELAFYNEFVSSHLHACAVGLGVTYEVLTGDFSQVNFSSARMGWIEFHRNLKTWRDQIMNAHFLNPLCQAFLDTLAIYGVNTQGVTYQHVPPKREMIDPSKEVSASIEAMRAGLTTLSDELMAQGKDPQEHLEQYKADLELLDKLKLTLECDPRVSVDGGNQFANQGGINEAGQSKTSSESDSRDVSTKVIRQRPELNGSRVDHGGASEAVELVRRRVSRGTFS